MSKIVVNMLADILQYYWFKCITIKPETKSLSGTIKRIKFVLRTVLVMGLYHHTLLYCIGFWEE